MHRARLQHAQLVLVAVAGLVGLARARGRRQVQVEQHEPAVVGDEAAPLVVQRLQLGLRVPERIL